MRGRKPTPTVLKLLRGNPGKRPINGSEPQYDAAEPAPPEELLHEKWAVARGEWDRIAPQLIAAGIMKRIDQTALMAYCIAYQHWITAHEWVRDHGSFIRTKNGLFMANPHFKVAGRVFEEMKTLMTEFGLTPSSRSRLKADLPAEEFDPMEEFLNGGKAKA
ncbi:Phage terminase, small subunit [Gammaproteobacteria bacterium]